MSRHPNEQLDCEDMDGAAKEREALRYRCMWWLKGWGRKYEKTTFADGGSVIKVHMRCVNAIERSRREFPS